MNKHIEMVKRWLEDPESVSLAELNANYAEAAAAADADVDDVDAAHAAYAADAAVSAATERYNAAFWVKRYEDLQQPEEA